MDASHSAHAQRTFAASNVDPNMAPGAKQRHHIGEVGAQKTLPPPPAPLKPIPFGDSNKQAKIVDGFKTQINSLKPGGNTHDLRADMFAAQLGGEISEAQLQGLETMLDQDEKRSFPTPNPGELKLSPKEQEIADVIAGADGKSKASQKTEEKPSSSTEARSTFLTRKNAQVNLNSNLDEGPSGFSALTGKKLLQPPPTTASQALQSIDIPRIETSGGPQQPSAPSKEKTKSKGLGHALTNIFRSKGKEQEKAQVTAAKSDSAESKKATSQFPEKLSDLRKDTSISIQSSTGAEVVKAKDGTQFVKKMPRSEALAGHLRNEYNTNQAYRVLGAKVPDVKLYERGNEGPVLLSKFVQNTQTLYSYIGKPTVAMTPKGVVFQHKSGMSEAEKQQADAKVKEAQDMCKKSFVADCLLANWDVTGTGFDNILIDSEKKEAYRIDNGAGLNYRAQGEKKKPEHFSGEVKEFETLRNPQMNPTSALLFATVTDEDIISQIEEILPKRDELLAAMPSDVKDIMSARFDHLVTYRDALIKKRNG